MNKKPSHAIAKLTVIVVLLTTLPANAEPMHFEKIRNGGNCTNCSYTQATGEITSDTPKQFDTFAASQKFGTGAVRLNSPGGSLVGGIALGELFRARGISTEVGSSLPIPQPTEPGLADRSPGICASACAYAYLGGVERNLDEDAKLGFHRFYQENSLEQPSAKLFTGQDLGNAQMITAALTLYTLKMGVDASLIALAASAGPNEMHWISRQDAQRLRVTYDPRAYKPWRVANIKDHRIDKLLILLDGDLDSSKSLVPASYLATDALLAGNLRASWQLGLGRLRSRSVNINDLITASFCVKRTRSTERATTISGTIDRLSTIFRKNDEFDRVANETLRISQNFHFLPSMKSLRQVCELECFPRSAVHPALKLRFLNGRELDMRDLANGFDVIEPSLIEQLASNNLSATAQLLKSLATKTTPHDNPKLNEQLSVAICHFKNLKEGKHRDEALDLGPSPPEGFPLP
jgi:hypothetical protein